MRFLIFGVLFGFILARVGASDYDAIAQMFLLQDLHIAGVIGVAVAVAAVGLRLFRRRIPSGEALFAPRPRKPGTLVGGLLFGVGWGVTGACPGTALVQLGEGKLIAIFTLIGILLGTLVYSRFGAVIEAWLERRSLGRRLAALVSRP
jgi:hypothetical protein